LNPATKRILGGAVRIILGLLLVGVLGFLYLKSQSGELRLQPQIATYLRQLRDIDAGWTRDMAAVRSDPLNAQPRSREGPDRLQPVLDRLKSDTALLGREDLDTGVDGLRQAFLDKQTQVEAFDRQVEALRKVLRDVLLQLAAVRQTTARVTAEAPVALRTRLAPLDGQLVSLGAELLRLYVQPDDSVRHTVEASTAALVQQAEGLPEALRTPLVGLSEPVALILRDEPALTQTAQQVERLPTGPRVNSMSDAFDRAFQAIADEKEQYRVYLAFYSLALLVFLAYVLWQLGRSYVKINHANEALRSANENLEQRVDERTKELSQALKHLKESELLLVQTEKMSSLGQMVAGIAHEINTPLAYVKSSLATLKERLPEVEGVVAESTKLMGLLERGDATDEQLSEQFTRVSTLASQFQAEGMAANLETLNGDALHGIEQISEIILSLKNFSRLDRSKVSRFNLNEGLESTLVIARNLVKHKTVHKRFGELPLIECSPSQINQVFLNLITNAAQATSDDQNGEITITTSVVTTGHIRVDVADNGHGIPDNVISKIFDPFFTTKDVGQGTGLGLSIAYKIVQEHGGRIEVKSKVGKGTMFSVLLPVKAAQPQALAA
jgi:two-component system, NtrC family, sensor kinase